MILNQVEKKGELKLWNIVRFQILLYCYFNELIIPESDLECLTLLALNGESELTSFCNSACNDDQKDRDSDLKYEKEIFKSPQCVRNSINRIENKNLIIKTGKGRKKIYVTSKMKLQTSGNIFVNVKLLRKDYDTKKS
tara:strand:- start:6174 stop:6587 length:414 start_codon:yes stop_codon:yes gene_type:complete